jgi:hypothetical protein
LSEKVQIKHHRRDPEELERAARESDRLFDPKSVGIGVAIFLLLLVGAFFWRFQADESSRKALEEFEFLVDEPDEEEFDLKDPQREILQEQVEEIYEPQDDTLEERPDIQISTNPVENAVQHEVVQTDAVEVMQDIDVEFTELDVLDVPEEITEIADEVTVALQPIAAAIPQPADIFRYKDPTPDLSRKVDLVNRAPKAGKPFKLEPAQFGDLEAPTVGEPGPASINLFGDGDYMRTMGGFGGIEARNSVDSALRWLALHQEANGRWLARKWDPEEVDENGLLPGDIPENPDADPIRDQGSGNDVGVTGLAALAFMGGGHTVRKGEYRANVRRALEWLVSKQDPASGLVGQGNMYEHAIATIALCEAHGRAPDETIAVAARKAVDFCTKAAGPDHGWRYRPRSEISDMSVTAWFVQALKTARLAGIKFDYEVFSRAQTYVDRLTDRGGTRESSGGVGYTFQPDMRYQSRPALTCAAMMLRQFSGMGAKSSLLVKGAELTKAQPPRWEQKNFYLWYYATYAMHNMGGEYRIWWNTRVRDVLLENQSKIGHQAGSWNPEGDQHTGGRVYTTALGALCLEVYYRYGDAVRSFGTAPDLDDLFFE